MKQKTKTYIISIISALAVGGLSAFLTRGNMDIYDQLNTPPLSPPGILFPIVWTILYALMGISAAMVWSDEFALPAKKRSAIYVYAASLFFNFFWSILFFNLNVFFISFLWLIVLFALIIATIIKYRRISPLAAYLQIPYALWVAFAGYLNLGIWYFN